MLMNLAGDQGYFTGTTYSTKTSNWDSSHVSTQQSRSSGTVDTQTNTRTVHEVTYEPNPVLNWLRKKITGKEEPSRTIVVDLDQAKMDLMNLESLRPEGVRRPVGVNWDNVKALITKQEDLMELESLRPQGVRRPVGVNWGEVKNLVIKQEPTELEELFMPRGPTLMKLI